MDGHPDPRRSLVMRKIYWGLSCALVVVVIIAVSILVHYGVVFALFPVALAAAAVLVIFLFLSQGGPSLVRDVIYPPRGSIDPRPPPYRADPPHVNTYRTHPPPAHPPPGPGICRYCGQRLYQGDPTCSHCGTTQH